MDPRGDIYPEVSVESGEFVVNATDNVASVPLRLVFDRTGKLLSETRKSSAPASTPLLPSRPYSFLDQLTEEQNGFERAFEGGTLIIPEYPRKHGGAPYLIREEGGRFTYHSLAWGMRDVNGVVDALVAGRDLYLLVTRFPATRLELWLHRFSLDTFKEEASVRLSAPAQIYHFPVCSNLIEYKGKTYVALVSEAWMGYDLLVNQWDGKASACTVTSLTRYVDWNTYLSLAHIDDDALVAFHYPGVYPGPLSLAPRKNAKIKTIPFKLK